MRAVSATTSNSIIIGSMMRKIMTALSSHHYYFWYDNKYLHLTNGAFLLNLNMRGFVTDSFLNTIKPKDSSLVDDWRAKDVIAKSYKQYLAKCPKGYVSVDVVDFSKLLTALKPSKDLVDDAYNVEIFGGNLRLAKYNFDTDRKVKPRWHTIKCQEHNGVKTLGVTRGNQCVIRLAVFQSVIMAFKRLGCKQVEIAYTSDLVGKQRGGTLFYLRSDIGDALIGSLKIN